MKTINELHLKKMSGPIFHKWMQNTIWVEVKELKQSAIDDIKELEKESKLEIKTVVDELEFVAENLRKEAKIEYIKKKFEITEEDLK